MLFLQDQGEEFETVFVNHGGDYPETYQYIEYLKDEGFQITELIPDVRGFHSIYDYAVHLGRFPHSHARWCTNEFKLRPQIKYFERPCINYIGIGFDERKRRSLYIEKGISKVYPLIDNKFTRAKCIDLIKEHGLKVPDRSTCYFCPMQDARHKRELFFTHPDLYERVKRVEAIQ